MRRWLGFLAPALAVALAGCGSGAPRRTTAAPVTARTAAVAAARVATRPRHRDSEARTSFVLAHRPAHAKPAPTPRSLAPAQAAPAATASTGVSPGAPSDAEIRRELKEMHKVLRAQQANPATVDVSLLPKGKAQPPAGAPEAVARVVSAGNAIAHFPYVYGGGHRSFVDSAYDCSGSVSYALAAGGMLRHPVTSGQLMHWGVPGPGRWITVWAKASHVFMYVGGLRFDTSFRNGPFGTRWQDHTRSHAGFVARHWPGL